MAIPVITLTESYAALTVLTQAQLNQAIGDNVAGSAEYALNNYCRNNLNQIALDVFGNTYDYTNDGIAAFPTPLTDLVPKLAGNETITGSWAFTGQVSFGAAVTSTSILTSSGQPRCRVYLTTAPQSIPDSTATSISFLAESYDVGGMHDNGILPFRIIVPTGGAGLYNFLGQINFAGNATGIRSAVITKNGSVVAINNSVATIAGNLVQCSFQDQASAGDYYELQAYQSSGAPLNVNFGANNTFFATMKVW